MQPSAFPLEQLREAIDHCMVVDKHSCLRTLLQLDRKAKSGAVVDTELLALIERIEISVNKAVQRKANMPSPAFPDQLPVSQRKDDIAKLIENNQVVVLAGETGSGKTTQLPKICLSLGLGSRGMIGHTQPRRIAASTVATRIAEELASPLGQYVGYQVRFQDTCSDSAYIKLMTDGILLAEIQNDPYLNKYEVLIIDEAHERSLNIDFLLGYIKNILPKRPDLKVIITSATIDVERFSKHFNDAPVIEVSGRTFPVDLVYQPRSKEQDDQTQSIIDAIHNILTNYADNRGDILIFLPGERDIRETAKAIKHENLKHISVLPLYARLSLAEQSKIFNVQKGRRIVLATNVAETSLTVPGIRFVIDPGFARVSRYSVRTKVQRLPIEPISRASANQRAGRCGRVDSGVCIRLYSEEDFAQRAEFTDPEIQRTNLAAVILQMLQLGVGDVKRFPFVDPPDHKQINDGFQLLEDLQAIDRKGNLTDTGKKMAALPIDPSMARMIIAAHEYNCLTEMLIITAALTVQDPRERPAEKQQAADEKHRRFWQDDSDFLAYLSLWAYAEEQRQTLSQNQWRKQASKEFLSFLRLREWRDLHHQLSLAAKKIGYKQQKDAASYEHIHKALLSGLIANIGARSEEQKDWQYDGTRNRKFSIFPGSSLFKKKPKWIVCAEMIETSRLFAHCVAKIDPLWVVQTRHHRIRHHYFEPQYQTKSGQVMAFDRVSLFGLVLDEKKRVPFMQIDPVVSREIFIRSALVEGAYEKSRHQSKPIFYQKNKQHIEAVTALEAKSRRKDILVDDELIYRFYDEHIPEDITHLAPFEQWRKQREKQDPTLLVIPKSLLMQHDADDITEAQFPDHMDVEGMDLKLSYHFEPGHPKDGVSIHIPVSVLHHLKASRLEWLVPGMLREKCIAMVKMLPKQWRKKMVPVPHYVDKMLARMKPSNTPLVEALSEQMAIVIGQDVPLSLWESIALDDYYRMNICVIDDAGREIAQSRDIETLKHRYKGQVQKSLAKAGADKERDEIKTWDFGKLEEHILLNRGSVKVKAFPALVLEQEKVALRLIDNPKQARVSSEAGVAKLITQQVSGSVKYLKKSFMKNSDMVLSVVDLGNKNDVLEDLVNGVILEVCQLHQALPKDKTDFERLVATANSQLIPMANEYEKVLTDVLKLNVEINKIVKSHKSAIAMIYTFSDIKKQLQGLIYKGFLSQTPRDWLLEYPRYLQAIKIRIEKAPISPQKDKSSAMVVQSHWENHEQRLEKEGAFAYRGNEHWQQYRWMIEELRVSLFAQTLKTKMPVSDKRLKKMWLESNQ